ncbi:hypothetical protein Tco_0759373 [Tanacetum coccineum]
MAGSQCSMCRGDRLGVMQVVVQRTNDLDAFDSDCDEAPSASAVLMAKLSAYNLDVLSKVPSYDDYQDNNVINQKTESEVVQDTTSSEHQDAMIMSVIEEMSNQVAKCNEVNKENKTVNESLTAELERYKEMVKLFEERQKINLTDREKYIDSQMRGSTLRLKKKELFIENDRLLEQIIFQDVMCTAMHSYDDLVKYADLEQSYNDEYKKCLELAAELFKKKDMVEKEHADTLRDIVEQARALKPLYNALDYACVDLLKGSRVTNLYTLSLEEIMKSSPICLLSKASKTKSCLWYQSEDLGKLKPKTDIGIFIGYSLTKKAYRIYNKRTRLIMEMTHVEFDELIAMASEQFDSGRAPQFMTPGTIKYFQPPPSVVSRVPTVSAPIPADITGTPSSTTIDQDAPSVSTSPTTEYTQAPVIHQAVDGQET